MCGIDSEEGSGVLAAWGIREGTQDVVFIGGFTGWSLEEDVLH